MLIDHNEVGALAGIPDTLENALGVALIRFVPGFDIEFINARLGCGGASPGGIRPDAIATSATVPLGVCR